MKKKATNYIIMPVNNQDMQAMGMHGGNIFGDIWSGVKSVGSYVVNKLPSQIGDAVLKNQLISKAAGFVPVVGQPLSQGLRIVGLGKKKKAVKSKKLRGMGVTTIKNKIKRKY
jgi:hypothetical protein